MKGVLRFLEQTWLATTLFLIVFTAIGWGWLSWDSARVGILPTIVSAPTLWWWLVRREARPRLAKGFLAGPVIGVASQALPGLTSVHLGMGP